MEDVFLHTLSVLMDDVKEHSFKSKLRQLFDFLVKDLGQAFQSCRCQVVTPSQSYFQSPYDGPLAYKPTPFPTDIASPQPPSHHIS